MTSECTYLTTRQLAKLIGVSESTVKKWRNLGTGPRYLIINKGAKRQQYRYPIQAVNQWQVASLT